MQLGPIVKQRVVLKYLFGNIQENTLVPVTLAHSNHRLQAFSSVKILIE